MRWFTSGLAALGMALGLAGCSSGGGGTPPPALPPTLPGLSVTDASRGEGGRYFVQAIATEGPKSSPQAVRLVRGGQRGGRRP